MELSKDEFMDIVKAAIEKTKKDGDKRAMHELIIIITTLIIALLLIWLFLT